MFYRARTAFERRLPDIAGARRTTVPGAVALTFDDGPVPGGTDRVLDVLAELDVRATFFCVGRNALRHPRLLSRVAAEGHAVGSHSMTHPHPRGMRLRALRADYRDGRDAVEQVLGRAVPLFRPPAGHLELRSAVHLRRSGLQGWLWSVDPLDWGPGVRRADVEQVATEAAGGDVVLLHDWVEQPWGPEALDRSATVEALPAIISAIRARGLDLSVLPS